MSDSECKIVWVRPELLVGNVYDAMSLATADLVAAGVELTNDTIRAECLARADELDRIARANPLILGFAADYRTVAHRALAA